MDFHFHFQLICAGETPDQEENKNEVPNLFGGYFTICVLITFILMVPIKIVCRQITSSDDGGSSIAIKIPTPKNLDSLLLNLFIVLLFITSIVLYLVYWKG